MLDLKSSPFNARGGSTASSSNHLQHSPFFLSAAIGLIRLSLLAPLIGLPAFASAQVLARHSGCADPATEGWSVAVGGVETTVPICSGDPCGRAWDVSDAIGGDGGVSNSRTITASQNCFAMTHGWRLRGRLRMHDTGPMHESIWIGFNAISVRYDMWFSENASGQAVVVLLTGVLPCVGITGPSFTATAVEACFVSGFHRFELVYNPAPATARLFVDGMNTGIDYPGHTLGLEQIPGIGWGAGSTCGYGASAFNLVEFEVPCMAEFNLDGRIDFFDYLDFVDAFSSNLPAADFNCDGTIDFFDYLDFVDVFSIGC